MRLKNLSIWIFIVGIAVLFLSCETEKKKDQPMAESPNSIKKSPDFDEDTAYGYVAKQCEFGPRVPNSKSHLLAGDFLESSLKKYGLQVTVQIFEAEAFDGKKLKLRNIIGSTNPNAGKRILIAAHWDSRPFADQDTKDQHKPIDGANDGASGVGIMLELARLLSKDTSLKIGVDFLLLDGEDYGQPDDSKVPEKKDTWCLGSQYWAKNKHIAGYTAYFGILLDMVGAKNARFAMDGTSTYFAPELQKRIWEIAARSGFAERFIEQKTDEIIDDHYYINRDAKIPMVDIIEYEPSDSAYFSATWHTHQDNIRNIDKTTLKIVGQTVLNVVYGE